MIEAHTYGEMIQKATGGILWSYFEYGSYQGDYVALVYKDKLLHVYKGRYGSCTGCDWLSDYHSGEIPDEKVAEYMEDNPPFISIPMTDLPETVEDLMALMPANTRTLAESFHGPTLEQVLVQIKNPDMDQDNLDKIEMEAAKKGLI